jgi:23S rRNA (cytosine1962-C5)-methyltransferase
LRIISREQIVETELAELIGKRVAQAASYRNTMVQDTDAFRVVFSEADRLPGLIVDRYADVLTMQVLTQAMDREDLRDAVITGLRSAYGPDLNVIERVESRIRELEDLPPAHSRLLAGSKSSTVFRMNGLQFHFAALAGQKTGAFLDQRENYVAAARYAHGDALDVFCYQGGFALHLARVCASVTGVDSSRAALELAEKNAIANASQFRCGEIDWLEADAFELLRDYAHPRAGHRFDTIVLDPPAFAKSKRSIETALRGYKEINLRAFKMLRPGGILITNSCSHHVAEAEFLQMLGQAAANAGRFVRILERRSQALDHPVVATIPETAYLKCVVCHVE